MLLALPRKQPNKVDIAGPLQEYVKSHFGKQAREENAGTFDQIKQSRHSFATSFTSQDAEDVKHRCLYWHSICARLQNKFPFGDNTAGYFAKANSVAIKFSWNDAFNSKTKASDSNIGLEKASTLYNLAVQLNMIASKMLDTEEDDARFKRASALLSESAAIFEYLSKSGELRGASHTVDLDRDMNVFCSAYCLAQAQECIYRFIVSKNGSPSLIAKLANAAADLFEQAVQSVRAKKQIKKVLVEINRKKYYTYCEHQVQYFRGLTQHYEGLAAVKKMESGGPFSYGIEICRINWALEHLRKASQKPCTKALGQEVGALLASINARKREAEEENNTIYHEYVPPRGDMEGIGKKVAVATKEFTPNDPLNALFLNLVPKDVSDISNKVREECRIQFDAAQNVVRESTDIARALLVALGLPAAIECATNQNGLPDSCWEKIFMIQASGGKEALVQAFQQLRTSDSNCRATLSEIKQKLEMEAHEDSIYRGQYGGKWTRNSSETITTKYHQDLDTALTHLTQANNTNQKSEQEAFDIDSGNKLQIDRNTLEGQMPAGTGTGGGNPAASEIKILIATLESLLDGRAQLKDDYLDKVTKMDLANDVMSGQWPKEEIIARAKAPLLLIDESIQQNVSQQDDLLQQIQTQFSDFEQGNGGHSESMDPRTQFVHELNNTCSKYTDLMKSVEEGGRFYTDLETKFLLPLSQNVDDYCMARQQEAQINLEGLGGQPADMSQYNVPSIKSPAQPSLASGDKKATSPYDQSPGYNNAPSPNYGQQQQNTGMQMPMQQNNMQNPYNPWAPQQQPYMGMAQPMNMMQQPTYPAMIGMPMNPQAQQMMQQQYQQMYANQQMMGQQNANSAASSPSAPPSYFGNDNSAQN